MAFIAISSFAEETIRVFGYVLDEDNRGIELANVYLVGSTVGTSTNRNGYYDLWVPRSDTMLLQWSMLGYQTLQQFITTDRDYLQINVVLPAAADTLLQVEVTAIRRQTDMMDHVDASALRVIPDAAGGNIENMLITFAGVSQNNELSSQYNVRGGNFDENLVYVNGIEIHRPLLIRSGQQEGLSFVNPQMVDRISFSAGGYAAQYGDKMSSVLDITYRKPTRTESSLSISLLGASAYVGAGDSTFTQMHGVRYKTSSYLLGTLPTKGNYSPNYVDYQTYMTWQLSPRWELSFMGNFSFNDYRFVPDSMTESFGTYQTARNLSIYYEGQEKDRFLTGFGALNLTGKVRSDLTISFTASGFYTNEQENYDILGEYILSEQPLDGSSASDDPSSVLGTGTYMQHARNSLQAGVATFQHRGSWRSGANQLQWGASVQGEFIRDQISEWEWRDSAGYSLPNTNDQMNLYYSMRGSSSTNTVRAEAFMQDLYRWDTKHGDVLLNIGARLSWWSFNNEVLCSPRATLTYIPGWKHDFCFRLGTGLYYQSPFYKEMRDTITGADGITRIQLNHNIKSQRSVHVVLGSDYYFRLFGRPFKLTGEAYFKYADHVISYTVDNVRIRYSGENDAVAYSTGVDLKLFGELVPGADSWISVSWMRAREQVDGCSRGWIPGPNEQRWGFTMFFQDYIPKFPQYKFHLKMIFSDGLPYGTPRNLETRAAFRTSPYRRIDIGATRTFSAKTDKFMRKSKHVEDWSIQFDVFNLVGFQNVNSYFWVSDAYGYQWASPNYLTGRMFNLHLSVSLK